MSDFSKLNSQSFQSMIESLALAEFGLLGQVFSSGPDAGRDFSFTGAVPGYEAREWDGYVVLQAKFKEKLEGGTRDVAWLISELRKERARFENKSKGRKRPNFYIIATNVRLSGSDVVIRGKSRAGGLTKVETELALWRKTVGISDYDVWSGDKIGKLLDMHPAIRQSYASWVTAGDVLTALLNKLGSPVFSDAIQRAMFEALARDQFVQLKDAGSLADDSIRSSQIFIDLPCQKRSSTSQHTSPEQRSEDVLSSLITRAKCKFDPQHASALDNSQYKNLIVLLGGPGQGKSTVGKFLVQLHRAELVSKNPQFRADPNLRDLIPEILERANVDSLGVPSNRYPVHISLPRYADQLSARRAGGLTLSLLAYMTQTLSADADQEIDRKDVRNWLATYPWLLVLDGLDEVPPSGARKPTIDAINSFLSEIATLNADAMVIVTTRPQGFNEDLPRNTWEYWYLTDLSRDRALMYAERLGALRNTRDATRRAQILTRISEAAESPATANIMKSPLQVTILYVIADSGGAIPSARWTLFQRYYDVLKHREMGKGGEIRDTLENNGPHVDRLHRWAGLVLHSASEGSGRAGSYLSREEFTVLLRECLRDGGVAPDDIESRVQELLHLALNRLVLLASQLEERVSFDVRSLQEFMAASALTNGSDRNFNARLQTVMKGAHWRHVVLIAASRCHAEGSHEHLITNIFGLTRQSDQLSDADHEVLSGARISLDLLLDGLAIGSAVHRQTMARHALELLNQNGSVEVAEIASGWEPATREIYLEALDRALATSGGSVNFLAWEVALALSAQGYSEATDLMVKHWPTEPHIEMELLKMPKLPWRDERVNAKMRSWIADNDPSVAQSVFRGIIQKSEIDDFDDDEDNQGSSKYVTEIIRLIGHPKDAREKTTLSIIDEDDDLQLCINAISDPTFFDGAIEIWNNGSKWHYLREIEEFCLAPSSTTLASALHAIEESKQLESARSLTSSLPWPLASLIDIARDEAALAAIVKTAEDKQFGDTGVWQAAEARWQRFGVTALDLSSPWNLDSLKNIDEFGFPNVFTMQASHLQKTLDKGKEIAALAQTCEDHHRKKRLSSLAFFGMRVGLYYRDPDDRTRRLLIEVASESGPGPKFGVELFHFVSGLSLDDTSGWQRIAALSTRLDISRPRFPLEMPIDSSINFCEACIKNPTLRTLLLPTSALIAMEPSIEPVMRACARLQTVLDSDASDNLAVKSAIAFLQLISPNARPRAAAIDVARQLVVDDVDYTGVRLLLMYLEQKRDEIGDLSEILLHVLKYGRARDTQLTAAVAVKLQEQLDGRQSGLAAKEHWTKLELPAGAFGVLETSRTRPSFTT